MLRQHIFDFHKREVKPDKDVTNRKALVLGRANGLFLVVIKEKFNVINAKH